MTNRHTYIILWLLCILGSLAVLPYVYALGVVPNDLYSFKLLSLTALQSAFMFGIVLGLSSIIVPKTDLMPFQLQSSRYTLRLGVISGLVAGVLIYILDYAFFKSEQQGETPARWTGLLASLYGAVNEEVLMRLFLFTLVYYIVGKVIPITQTNRTTLLWCVTFAVAICFGLGHLPLAFKLLDPTPLIIARILLLNAIPGIIFGWLYWSNGLWTAMLAHFVTDLLIHVVFV